MPGPPPHAETDEIAATMIAMRLIVFIVPFMNAQGPSTDWAWPAGVRYQTDRPGVGLHAAPATCDRGGAHGRPGEALASSLAGHAPRFVVRRLRDLTSVLSRWPARSKNF